ncbi:MAG: efflux RND transporter periplasmic adaptor subunit [Parachlamydiaceae bacterium]|nr:efflux RND transporter periplasmic adaptor subunit [Parachlamydiaceae bacterium]
MAKKISSKYIWSGVAAVAASALTFFWISDSNQHVHDDHDHHHEEHEEFIVLSPEQINSAGIKIESAQAGKLQELITSPGKIVLNADRIAHIYPKVSGTAKFTRKNLGESVKDFESLALLESQEVAAIKIAYLTALQEEKYALKLLELEKKLHDKGLGVLQEYENSINTYEKARLAVTISRQSLLSLGLSHDEIAKLPTADVSTLCCYELRAPFNGNILHRHITVGELISPTSEIYTIADLSNLWVEISLYPQRLPLPEKGQPILLRDTNGRTANAELLYIGSSIDEDTRRIQAIALLENADGQWQPGTYVTATIATTAIPVPLAISRESVQKIDGQECAFIAKETGFEIRPITTGRSDDNTIEVISGIEKGERYAATNSFILKAEHEKDEAEHMH